MVPIPVPAIQSKIPSPFCHSQNVGVGNDPKSQKTSSTDAVGGGTVTGGYLEGEGCYAKIAENSECPMSINEEIYNRRYKSNEF